MKPVIVKVVPAAAPVLTEASAPPSSPYAAPLSSVSDEAAARRSAADHNQVSVSRRLEAGIIKQVLHEVGRAEEILLTQIHPHPIHPAHHYRWCG